MGEFSKRIGEIGEDIVADFLSLAGWPSPIRNIDIPSIDYEKHGKKTHGIDAIVTYKSSVISRALENVLVSVKYSKDKYPNSPVEKFKDYYKDLGMAIESFKKSDLRSRNYSGIDDFEVIFDRGVIFWINNVLEENKDILTKLYKIEIPKDFNHDGIFLIDNHKLSFFYDSINYAKQKYPGKNIQFTYFNTGLNGDDEIPKNGSILPVQYLASGIIPIRIEENGKIIFVMCYKDNFEEESLIKLMGLAKNITANFQSNTIIAFPDYNKLHHEQIVSSVKLTFEETSFVNFLSIDNFTNNFRN